MITTISKLLSSLRKYQVNHSLLNADHSHNELIVFLHTSIVACSDCSAIKKHISSYKQLGYRFAFTEEVRSELQYLADNKKSIFRKNAKYLLDAYFFDFIELRNHNDDQLKHTAVLVPSLPFAFRLRYKNTVRFNYIVTLSDYDKVAVIINHDQQTSKWLFSSKGSVESSVTSNPDKLVQYKHRTISLKNKKQIEGGEAILYKNRNKLLKLYRNGGMTKVKVNKIKSLIACANRCKDLAKITNTPIDLLKNVNGLSCGVVIPYLKKYKSLNQILTKGVSARKCRKLLRLYLLRIFELNLMSIVLSDINPSNVMYHKNTLKIVDTDSFQIGTYASGCYRQDILHPAIHKHIEHIDSYIRDVKYDSFSFACMVFNLLVGVKPTRYKDSDEFSNFVTHPFLYRNTPGFTHNNIFEEALENWNNNLSDSQRNTFVDIFRDNRYISPPNLDKSLFGD